MIEKLTPSEREALKAVAQRLGVPTDWLAAVINFETAGTWNPTIKNPNSSARGLIQFLDKTAQGLGYQSAVDLVTKHPTIESQLRGPVLKYFLQFAPPFKTKQELWFSVFLPRYKKSPMNTVIYHDDPAKQAAFRRANPGIKTVGDYYHKLEKMFYKGQSKVLPVIATLALGFLAFRFFFLRG